MPGPYDTDNVHDTVRRHEARPVVRQDVQIADEIKRRQIALMTRYVMTVGCDTVGAVA